jgi:hypothetical protein
VQKDFKTFIRQGEQVQGRSWRLTKKKKTLCVCEERRSRRKMKCEKGC